jgi:DNA-binding response OmpR family regulator
VLTENQVNGLKNTSVAVGDLFIDPGAHAATLSGAPLLLTRQEFDLLLALARCCGRVKTREQLLLDVADRDFEVFDRSIYVLIASLRKKLSDDAQSPRWIETIRGVGYALKRPEAS